MFAIEQIQPRLVAFEDQMFQLRVFVADIYQDEEEWLLAAQQLQALPLESSTKYVRH